MGKPLIGVVGGTGLGEHLAQQHDAVRISMETPFGRPSGPLLRVNWHGVDVIFLNRHGEGHHLNPTAVPYRANIFALKQLGVTRVIASGAVGSLRGDFEPGELVICDQVIDKTSRRVSTFFDEGVVAHVEMAEPFCGALRQLLISSGEEVETAVHGKGTYVVMEGPQFSSRAESHMHRQWGGDLIGMTCMPEAKLAREAEMCYALIALVTDYDCWREPEPEGDKNALLQQIMKNLNRATVEAAKLIEAAIHRLAGEELPPCPCGRALELAIWSDKKKVDGDVVHRLEPLIGRYFSAPLR